jgi:polyisoprenoid-binding protein YceI
MKRMWMLLCCGCMLLVLAGCGQPAEDAAQTAEAAEATPALGDSADLPDAAATTATEAADGEAAQQPASPGSSDAAPAASGPVSLTAENTKIEFIGKHTDDKPDRVGTFKQLSGTIERGADGKSLKSISVEIQTDSLETEFPMLTSHLKSPDFLEVRQYPTINFESTTIAAGEGGAHQVSGKLTLHGIEKEITFPATVTFGDEGFSLASEFVIDRTEYGINYSPEGVKNEVTVTVTVGSAG